MFKKIRKLINKVFKKNSVEIPKELKNLSAKEYQALIKFLHLKRNNQLLGLVTEIHTDSNSIVNCIVKNIKNAKFDIKIAVPWFSNYDIIHALPTNFLVPISIKVSDEESNTNALNYLKKINPHVNLKIIKKQGTNRMHHKFCIIDNKTIICGSFNFSTNALNNKEFILKIHGKDLVDKFTREFNSL